VLAGALLPLADEVDRFAAPERAACGVPRRDQR
jgi:hypothetical protein